MKITIYIKTSSGEGNHKNAFSFSENELKIVNTIGSGGES